MIRMFDSSTGLITNSKLATIKSAELLNLFMVATLTSLSICNDTCKFCQLSVY